MKIEVKEIDEKKVSIYINEEMSAPIVFSSDVSDDVAAILGECEAMNCPAFHLVSITGLRWDEELSPWAHKPIVTKDDHFTGEADRYLSVLENEILPYVKQLIPGNQPLILHGYSMGGLFALYAAHKSTRFTAYAAPSGSVWYPGFVDYVISHGFETKPKSIYLSLGDRESRTKNIYLSKTEENMQELLEYYRGQDILSTFELNEGNHFKDVSYRIAKAISWTLNNYASLEQANC